MIIVTYRKVFYTISAILVLVSVAALLVWGLQPGIDFTGGSIVEVEYTNNPPRIESVRSAIQALELGEASVRETGETGYIIRTRDLSPEEHDLLLRELAFNGDSALSEKRFDSVGPVLGKEALQKSWMSIVLVIAAIVLFITFAFRKVSKPVSSWKYGLIAIIGLIHNVTITAGAFSLLGYARGIEVDTLFVTALLVILGFSIHDTIVVFDRVRENLRGNSDKERKSFDAVVGMSIRQTFVRSINTSFTTLLAIFVLYLIGADATKHFALALLVGIAAGTYSSIFLCSPLLVTVHELQKSRG